MTVNVGNIDTEVTVEGAPQDTEGTAMDVKKDELREVVRELVEEMLERYLRVQERR